jgi:hypothetical protein
VVLEQLFLLALVAVTSVTACAVGIAGLGLRPAQLWEAGRFALQLVGMSTLFFVGNLAIGLVCMLAIRGATGTFVSVYLLNDPTLGVLSAAQGVCFECWRTSGDRGRR